MKLNYFLCALIVHTLFFLLAFDAMAQGGSRIVPRPGLYRCGSSSQTVELSGISSSSMRLRGWQTGTPKPPEDRNAYFHAGTATLLSDGVTWRAHARDVDGYCCGNNVESEFRFPSPSSFVTIRWRLWPLTGAAPGLGDLWQPVGANECKLVGEVAEPPVKSLSPANRPAPPHPAPPPPDRPELIDSGARFSSLSGDIQIVHEGDSRKNAKFAKMDTVIYVGDHVITGESSSVIFGFMDYSTFLLKEESEIIVTEPPGKHSNLALVAGNIWVNVKKMMVDGTMHIDFGQAVCGIKGTKLVLEEKPDSSTTKVIEGSVQVSSKRRRQTATVNAGYMVTATAAGLGPVRPFDTSSEIDDWKSLLPATTQAAQTTSAAMVNLARGKRATQSSTGYGGTADRAVDGNTNGDYFAGSMTHTEEANLPQPWWQVDLGRPAQIDHLILWNRKDCCSQRLASFWVFVSDSPFPGGDASALLRNNRIWHYEFSGTAGPQTRIAVGKQGRYIRVQLSSREPLSLAEVEVFGR